MNSLTYPIKDLYSRNWGDAIGRFIYRAIAHKHPRTIPMEQPSEFPHYLTTGSVLRMCDNNSIVWGSGFISNDDGLGLLHWGDTNSECRRPPARIHAVRGPLSRGKLIAMGVPCPPVYGDPALLLPRFYTPSVHQEFELGIIPHHSERDLPIVQRLERDSKVKVIDVVFPRVAYLLGNRKYHKFVDDICRCKRILSSSLHGIIASDAYGVPSQWIKLSDRVDGDGFKFADYFMSIHRELMDPIYISDVASSDSLLCGFRHMRGRIETEPLLNECPFRA